MSRYLPFSTKHVPNVISRCKFEKFCHIRAEAFDDGNLQHEMQLLELWTLLQPDKPLLTRVTKQWLNIADSQCYIKADILLSESILVGVNNE